MPGCNEWKCVLVKCVAIYVLPPVP